MEYSDIVIKVEYNQPDINIDFAIDNPQLNISENDVRILTGSNIVWKTYETTDWEQVGTYYKLSIPFSEHNCLNPAITSSQVYEDSTWNSNIVAYRVTANDTIIVWGDTPVKIRLEIRGA